MMASQSDAAIAQVSEETSKNKSQVSCDNDFIVTTSPEDKEHREDSANTNADLSCIDGQQTNSTASSVVDQMDTIHDSSEFLQQTTASSKAVPIPSTAVNDGVVVESNQDVMMTAEHQPVCTTGASHTGTVSQTSVNKGTPHTDAPGDSGVCTPNMTEPPDTQAALADSEVRIKQEETLESASTEIPQSGTSASADQQNTQLKVEKLCVANQKDSVETAHPAHVHVTIKQEQSVAFHDLVTVADGSDGEGLDEGSTELSCYTLDYRGHVRKDSSSSIDSSDSDQPDSDDVREIHKAKTEKQKAATEVLKTKGELLLDNLPPLEELHIMLAEDVVMAEVGSIRSLIGPLVVVEAKPDLPALNMDTILFLDGRKVMGQVFETFGPVASPFYSVRYNCQADIERLGIEPGQAVFYAPSETQYTHYIFLEQLISLKGSDASWEDNNEPPEKFIDFSDDEEERHFKAKKRNKNKDVSGDGETERKQRTQSKRKQDQRSQSGQESSYSQSTRQNSTQNSSTPPWRNATPNPFSQMGRTPDRGGSGQHPPPGIQQWPPPSSQMAEHSPFLSPPPRPPMFPGIDENSMNWRPYGQPPGWNQGYMNMGHMNGPSQWGTANDVPPYSRQPPNFAMGPSGPLMQHRPQFGERPNFMPGPRNNWHP